MENSSGKAKPGLALCHRPTWKDLWVLKGAICELIIVTSLFVASLADGEIRAILALSIAVTVLATILILWDVGEMVKKRDFRKILIGLIALDCVVLVASSVVLHFWILVADGRVEDDHVPTYYGLDACEFDLTSSIHVE